MDALLKKMKFKPGQATAVVGAPTDFAIARSLDAAGVPFHESLRGKFDFLVLCVHNRAEVAQRVPAAMGHLAEKGFLWICYPKLSGKLKTDLSRDHGWDSIMGIGLRHLNLISIDDDWTAWGTELGSNEVSAKSQQKSDARRDLLAQYMNHETREMWYPDDMAALFAAHPAEAAFFHDLSFTNRKEYVEWIVTAKRPETRQQRLTQMVTYLSQGRKNPAGR